jgi:hypothetical protein
MVINWDQPGGPSAPTARLRVRAAEYVDVANLTKPREIESRLTAPWVDAARLQRL